VPPAESFGEWLRQIIRERTVGPAGGEAAAIAAAEDAIVEARRTGTVLVGDISNTLMTPALLAANRMAAVVFHELLGFNASDADGMVREAWRRVDDVASQLTDSPHVGMGVVAHAPYSVSPALFEKIARAKRTAPLAVHLAESNDEVEFLERGTGALRALLQELRAWNPDWVPPGVEADVYLERLGYLTPGCLVVHGVHLSPRALERLRDRNAVVVTCPRSNQWVAAGIPPISHFYASGVRVAIGTDSRASVDSLNMFDEMAAVRRVAPEITAPSILESATRTGAEALGFDADYGTLSVGKRAALVTVRVPRHVRDVEEYLVSGIDRDAIHAV
jgi:cytosine/adenosine deaminase-related metal-dependent hydrolase